jgi:3-phenylpropionate/trans-cinnamate dioxygenase ferredoxin reductase subunit
MVQQQFVILGGGLAGATAAGQLRESGFEGQIHLFAGENHDPYIRPPLSKEYFSGGAERDSIFVHPAKWYREHGIILATGQTATTLEDHSVTLESGRTVPFDRLLLATGSAPRQLDIPGARSHGIHYLRTVEDSENLRSALSGGGREVVFVGSGWIGLELAAAARGYGNTVTVVGPEKVPLARPLGEELGTLFQRVHESHGVLFRLETSVVGFEQSGTSVTGVVTDRGVIPADLVVVGIGAIPNTSLAEAAGLEVDNGIVVDEHLATSMADVFAAGDVANAYHPVIRKRMRNEHWATAIAGGTVAARSMLGEPAVLDAIPYFYTDQYDLGMEYSGYPPLTDTARIVYRGDRDKREFIAFWIAGGMVVAGMNVNLWDVNDQVQQLIRSGRAVDEAKLIDSTVELTAL